MRLDSIRNTEKKYTAKSLERKCTLNDSDYSSFARGNVTQNRLHD